MTAAAIGDFNHALSRLDVETSRSSEARLTRRNDAQMGIQEIEVLRQDLDMVAPPDAAELAEPLVEMYRGTLTSGDHLRLAQATFHDARTLRAAVGRVLSIDTTAHAGSQDAVLKEAKMRRLLQALDGAVEDIQRRAAMNMRD